MPSVPGTAACSQLSSFGGAVADRGVGLIDSRGGGLQAHSHSIIGEFDAFEGHMPDV